MDRVSTGGSWRRTSEPGQQLGRLVEGQRDERQHADHDPAVRRAPAEERQDVDDHVEEQRADDGADERPAAAEQAGPAEHGGGDARQREAAADARVADADLGGEEEAADRRGEGGDEERPHEQVADPHAAAVGRLLVEAHGPRRQPARRAVQPDVGGERDDDDDDERDRHEADAVEQEVDELEADRPVGLRAQPQRDALEDAQHRQRGDDRRQLETADQDRR